ncbi:MAG TPA: cysteine--tRNA ligase [Archaeoglobus sp.]|nr:cysteine--tRNA ligase [Archaeoglobus sp.]
MRLFNTLTRKMEDINEIVEGNEIRIYVCGITAYDFSHIGHARSAVVFDTLWRYLEYKGFNVIYVQNFTDVDDKIVRRAIEEKKTQKEIAERFIKEYFEDISKLNVRKATYHPKVTDHIKDIIKFVDGLINAGFAYVVDGDVYFHVPAFEKYGELSKQPLEELNKHRIEPDPRKKDVKDFALWKSAKEDDLKAKAFFDSPWGKGRPGWHIECSVMSSKYLGVPFHIHGGGKDLIFPHHENERAQSYALFGKEPVKLWMHNDFVTIRGEKMSKSLGNIVRIRDVLKKYPGEVLRCFLLTAHYRSPIDYSEDSLERALKSYNSLREALINLDMEIAALKSKGENRDKLNVDPTPYVRGFEEAMDDDLNTPKALARLHEFARYINKIIPHASLPELEEIYEYYRKLCGIMGFFEKYNRVPILKNSEMKLIIERESCRMKRDFERADKIREEFRLKGIQLIDTPRGTRWRWIEK